MRVLPPWVPLIVISCLFPIAVISMLSGHEKVAKTIGHLDSAFLSLLLVGSVSMVVHNLVSPTAQKESPMQLLTSAAALWAANILIFACWYWRIDAGGPIERDQRHRHEEGAFLFPQMTMTLEMREQTGMEHWSPGFVDYLFLAFNTSTALSPADTGALTRWAKVLMMLQSLISLTIIILMAARAVNILQ